MPQQKRNSVLFAILPLLAAATFTPGSNLQNVPIITTSHPPSAPPTTQAAPAHPPHPTPSIVPTSLPRGPGPSEAYASPGIATWQGGQWVGSEDLYNLSNDLGLYVEIVVPPTKSVPLQKEDVRKQVEDQLARGGVRSHPFGPGGASGTPLPFLHVLIMAQPFDEGVTAKCELRLFEQVNLTRVRLEKDIVWQAITWERGELLVAPKEKIVDQITVTLNDIVGDFIERYQVNRNPSSQ